MRINLIRTIYGPPSHAHPTQMRTSYADDDEPTTATMNTGTFTFTEANRSQENEEKTAKHCTPKRENEEEALR